MTLITLVCRIFGDLKLVTDLGFWGALSSKIASVFVHLVRISCQRAYVLQFFAKYLKTSPKVSKVISHHF